MTTVESGRLRSLLLFGSTYLFPAIGFPLITYAWWRSSDGSWPFVVVAMGVPVLFGYLMPGVAIHVVKRWRMTSGPRVGSYYIHHGFVYGSKLAFVLLVVVRSLASVDTALDVASVIIVTGAATAFGGWWHDAQAVRAGKIAIDGGLEALASFAPPSYFAMGATYACVVIAAHHIVARDAGTLAWVFPSGLAIMCGIPTLVFLAVDPPSRRALREHLARKTEKDKSPAC
jgi:hypothetical protein